MAHGLSATPDRIPHAGDVLAAVAQARRAIRDAQTEVVPFGSGYQACVEAETALESLTHYMSRSGDKLAAGAFGRCAAQASSCARAAGEIVMAKS